jgi:NAD(P)H-hydrate epimerase
VIPVLNAAEMRAADRRTIEEIGLPGAVLMENAGTAVAQAVTERHPDARRLVILCGKGNNGGDGLVVARRLLARRPEVYLLGTRADMKGDARLHLGVLERSGGNVTEIADGAAWERVRERAVSADLVVDAILGTGLKERPTGLVGQVVSDLGAAVPATRVVAVDIPSGLSSDTGEASWTTVSAALTVTFAAPKWGHVLPPACDRAGELMVADIGIPASVLAQTGARLWLLEAADAAAAFAPRAPGAHKGTYGHLLVVAGSVGKSGAAILAATAALVSGAGLVTVATPAPALPLVAAGRAEVMTEPLSVSAAGGLDREALDRTLSLARARDAVVLGPGLGQEPGTREFVREFVARCPSPLVVDADGLNALAPAGARRESELSRLERASPTVLTPHPGEMARLTGSRTDEIQRRRVETARMVALETGAVVVLKGQRTVIADVDGRAVVNPTGNPGMASGGSGDVLAGMLGALLARGLSAWTSAAAGVYLHGLAGDLAAARRGQESLVAGDVIDALPDAVRSLPRPTAEVVHP